MVSQSNNFPFERLQDFIPAYLTDGQQASFLRSLADKYPDVDYYASRNTLEILQGDGWNGLEIITFEEQAKIPVSGIILSNTCDISSENPRLMAPNIIFSVAVSASCYEHSLLDVSGDKKRVTSHMQAIYTQSMSNRFYFPKASNMNDAYIALLDHVHTIPRDYFLRCPDRKACICLSNAGFFLFILKLSMHFCRLADSVDRTV